MAVPYASEASVPLAKLTDYLLNPNHSAGGPKARFFLSIGFTATDPVALRRALVAIAASGAVSQVLPTQYGVKYVVDGPIDAPSGLRPRLRTVWVVESGTETLRFVTAYPLR